jgi:hypothetical protein
MKIVQNTLIENQLAEVNAKLSLIDYDNNGQPLCNPDYYNELIEQAETLEQKLSN